MKRIDAVCREENPSTGSDDAPELADGGGRIEHVLEHLQAEHDVVARVLHRNRIDRSVEVGARVAGDVEADELRGAAQERVVRTVAAADVEHACPRDVLRGEPVDEWAAYCVLH